MKILNVFPVEKYFTQKGYGDSHGQVREDQGHCSETTIQRPLL